MTSRHNDLHYVRQSLRIAIQILQMRDNQLLLNSAHELSVTHRLATYLELFFVDMHVDCDYNRDIDDPKKVDGTLRRPDIIVHRRQSPRENVLAIETKVVTNTPSIDHHDSEKLARLKKKFKYQYAAAISIGPSKAMIQWEDGSKEEIHDNPTAHP